MDDYRAKKAYELLEKKRLATIAKNAAEGRTGIIKGLQLSEKTPRSDTLAGTMDALRNEGKLTNLENTIKSTGTDTIGIAPEVRNKSKFFNLDKRMGQGIADGAEDIAEVAKKEVPLLKNSRGFAKLLPMLGMGAAGLGALSIANKVEAGELGSAGLEAADIATDYLPGVGTAKFAVSPSELGNSELPEDEMLARQKFNEAMKNKLKG